MDANQPRVYACVSLTSCNHAVPFDGTFFEISSLPSGEFKVGRESSVAGPAAAKRKEKKRTNGLRPNKIVLVRTVF